MITLSVKKQVESFPLPHKTKWQTTAAAIGYMQGPTALVIPDTNFGKFDDAPDVYYVIPKDDPDHWYRIDLRVSDFITEYPDDAATAVDWIKITDQSGRALTWTEARLVFTQDVWDTVLLCAEEYSEDDPTESVAYAGKYIDLEELAIVWHCPICNAVLDATEAHQLCRCSGCSRYSESIIER